MHYSTNPAHVRVDLFKESGKWYATEVIEMTDFDCPDLFWAVKQALEGAFWIQEVELQGRMRFSGMTAVVLEPCHKHAHPVMIKIPAEGKFTPRGPFGTGE